MQRGTFWPKGNGCWSTRKRRPKEGVAGGYPVTVCGAGNSGGTGGIRSTSSPVVKQKRRRVSVVPAGECRNPGIPFLPALESGDYGRGRGGFQGTDNMQLNSIQAQDKATAIRLIESLACKLVELDYEDGGLDVLELGKRCRIMVWCRGRFRLSSSICCWRVHLYAA